MFAPQKHKKKQKKSGVWMSKVKRVGTVAKNWFEADLCQIASRAFHILLKKNVVVLFSGLLWTAAWVFFFKRTVLRLLLLKKGGLSD